MCSLHLQVTQISFRFFLIYFKSCKSSIENEKTNKKKPLYVKISEKFKNIKISIK